MLYLEIAIEERG